MSHIWTSAQFLVIDSVGRVVAGKPILWYLTVPWCRCPCGWRQLGGLAWLDSVRFPANHNVLCVPSLLSVPYLVEILEPGAASQITAWPLAGHIVHPYSVCKNKRDGVLAVGGDAG